MTRRHRLDIARTHTMADAARSEPMGFIQVEAAPRQALKRAGCLILLARQRRLGQLTRRRTRSEPLDYARALSHWSQFILSRRSHLCQLVVHLGKQLAKARMRTDPGLRYGRATLTSRPATRSQGSPTRDAALHTAQAKVVPRRCAVLSPFHPARPCRQHHGTREMAVLVHQSAARFWDDPLGTDQERHAAAITDAEADQMCRQLLEIAIGQIGDDTRESFERCQSADISNSDVVNEQLRVTIQIE